MKTVFLLGVLVTTLLSTGCSGPVTPSMAYTNCINRSLKQSMKPYRRSKPSTFQANYMQRVAEQTCEPVRTECGRDENSYACQKLKKKYKRGPRS